jgi:hypothetical protein
VVAGGEAELGLTDALFHIGGAGRHGGHLHRS